MRAAVHAIAHAAPLQGLPRPALGAARKAQDHGGHPGPSDEALHEQADALRAPRNFQLFPNILHRGQRQETPRHHRQPQQLRVRQRPGLLPAHSPRSRCLPVRSAQGHRQGLLWPGGEGLRPQEPHARGPQDGTQREEVPPAGSRGGAHPGTPKETRQG